MYSFNGNVGFMCVFPCMPPFPADIEPILLRLLSFKEHLCQFYSISTGRGCTSHCSTISGLISVCLIWWSVSLFICQNKCFFSFLFFYYYFICRANTTPFRKTHRLRETLGSASNPLFRSSLTSVPAKIRMLLCFI